MPQPVGILNRNKKVSEPVKIKNENKIVITSTGNNNTNSNINTSSSKKPTMPKISNSGLKKTEKTLENFIKDHIIQVENMITQVLCLTIVVQKEIYLKN